MRIWLILIGLVSGMSAALGHVPDSLYRLTQPGMPDSVRAANLNRIGRQLMYANLDSSYIYTRQALDIALQSGDVFNQSYSQICLGDYHNIEGKSYAALDHYQQGLLLVEGKPYDMLHAALFNNRSNLLDDLARHHEALQGFRQAATIYRRLRHWKYLANTLNNIGIQYFALGEADSAAHYYHQSLSLRQQYGYNTASVKNNLAELKLAISAPADAIHLLREVITEKIANAQHQRAFSSYMLMADAFSKLNQDDSTVFYYQKAYQLANLSKNYKQIFESVSKLAHLYEQHRNFEKSINYYKKYLAAKDSLNATDLKHIISLMEENFLLEKEALQNQLMQQEMDQANLAIRASYRWNLLLSATLVIAIGLLIVAYKYYQARNRSHQELEEEVAKQTADLLHKNQQLEEYAYMNAHQIRGPLARILGLVLAFRAEAAYKIPDFFFYLEAIEKSANELDEVINSINDILSEESKNKSSE